jgi:hypothetical protein
MASFVGDKPMKYILLMNGTRDRFEEYMSWPKELLEANMAFMHAFTQRLAAAGELVVTEGLASPSEAKLVRAGKDGTPITDGVFPESKEFLAGYWIVDVESAPRAYEIAAEASSAPGLPMKSASALWIEVRQIMSGPPQ